MSEPASSVPHGKVLIRASTKLPPCSIVVHSEQPNLIIFGTYKLEEESRTRRGTLEFWVRVLDEQGEDDKKLLNIPSSPGEESNLRLVSELHTPDSSILDVKSHPTNSNVFFTAQSTGEIIVWKFEDLSLYYDSVLEKLKLGDEISSFLPPKIISQKSYSITEEDRSVLVLSLSIAPVAPYTTISATLTSGAVIVCKLLEPDFSLKIIRRVSSAHDLEAWVSSFLRESDQVLFSGGDDAVLAAHDLRVSQYDDEDDDTCTVWKTRRIHEAGVVSILSLSDVGSGNSNENPYILWTGGYDDMLKEVDIRTTPSMLFADSSSTMMPIPPRAAVSEMNLGGGVWKLIPKPASGSNTTPNGFGSNTNDGTILACCMYGGARILERNKNSSETGEPATVIKTVTQGHTSMVYGGAWLDQDTAVTCSFYDQSVQIWK